jgi:hypothetical protein
MSVKRHLIALLSALVLTSATGIVLTQSAMAAHPAAKQKQHRQATAEIKTADEDESAESAATADESSSAASSEDSNSDTEEAREPVSLLGVATNIFMIGVGVLSVLCFLAVAHLIPGALVWHGGNILRGGKKPEVG